MPSTKGFYRIESESLCFMNESPVVELVFALSGEQPKGEFAPPRITERFSDLKRADDLINCGERIGIMVTQWLGNTAVTIVAKESELPANVLP